MKNTSGIYQIKNLANNKIYIGSAVNFKFRWNIHKCLLLANNHTNIHLQRAWNNNNGNNFEFSVIIYCSIENLIFYEQRFLDAYWDNCKNCYNICKTAGSQLGYKHTKESKLKMSISSRGVGHPVSEDTKRKISEANKGHEVTDQTREKISAASKGKKMSEDNRLKMIERLTGHEVTTETREKISKANTGKIRSVEAKKNISSALTGRKLTKEHIDNIIKSRKNKFKSKTE